MKTLAKVAAAVALGAAVTTTLAFAPGVARAEDGKPTVSRAAGKDLQEAQKAIAGKNYAEALKHLDTVDALGAKRNEYDTYAMNSMFVQAYLATGRQADAEKAAEAVLNSKYVSPQQVPAYTSGVATLSYALKDYDKAIEYGEKYIKAGYPDRDHRMRIVVAQSYYLKGDFPGTRAFVGNFVEGQIKAGEIPTEDMLLLGRSAVVKLNDAQGITRWTERLLTYYPKREYWENEIDTLLRMKTTDKQLLQIYLLANDVGALTHPEDFTEMAQIALDQGSPGIAVAILQKGFDSNVFTDTASKNRNQHLLISAKQAAAQDQPTLARSEAQGAAAATGQLSVGVGIGYLGYGQYDKAAQDLAAGLKKGGVKDPVTAQLLLGVAQYKAGNKDAAVQAFHQVRGDPVLEKVAGLWAIHAAHG
ncbi:MAG TPA: tetratricopeptide repeat protein [Steroidobacteraceae bacterium]|nr:tetratricopeptide repeat protein [Steroidobacteraceae bacterium]